MGWSCQLIMLVTIPIVGLRAALAKESIDQGCI